MPKKQNTVFRLPGHRRWNADDAASILGAIEASGTTIEDFAKKHRLRPERIELWRRRLGAIRGRPVDFHEVVRGEAAPAMQEVSTMTFEIVLSRGVVVRFAIGTWTERVAAIIHALEEGWSC